MSACYDTGALRAYLDKELPATEMADVAAHVDGCADCRIWLADLTRLDEEVRGRLRLPEAAAPPADVALARLQSPIALMPVPATTAPGMVRSAGARRSLSAAAIIVAALLAVSLIPSVRAAAGAFLQVFRAQSVVYVPVSNSRVQQLTHLHVDPNTLFLAKPQPVGEPAATQQAGSLAQAGALAGFDLQTPAALPSAPTATTYAIQGQNTYQFQVNVATLRSILASLGVTDVAIPDALGQQPISVVLPPTAQLHYQGKGYDITLIEGVSPTVTLPPGVDLAQLGQAILEVYGMSPQQAAALSKQIDWRSTLVFPYPLGTTRLQQVTVNGAQGMLLTVNTGDAREAVVYWQQGSHFFVLTGQGDALGTASIVALANSVR